MRMSSNRARSAFSPFSAAFRSLICRNVGLFRYFRPEQAPNFALALPMLALTAAGVAAYVRAEPWRAATLGLLVEARQGKPRELRALEQQARARRAAVRCVAWRAAEAARCIGVCAQAPQRAAEQQKRCAQRCANVWCAAI